MARRLVQAPNTYPSWFAPRGPVELVFGGNYLTNFPAHYGDVGPPAARLCYRIVEPGDYHLEVSRASWVERGDPRSKFTVRATVPGSPTGFTDSPRGTVVLLHCYGLSKTVMGPWALRLAQDGWRCLLVDLRGHGKSSGQQIHFGVQEVRDLSQLLDELARDGSLTEPVAVLGYSYGAALALRWATVESLPYWMDYLADPVLRWLAGTKTPPPAKGAHRSTRSCEPVFTAVIAVGSSGRAFGRSAANTSLGTRILHLQPVKPGSCPRLTETG